MTGRFYLIIALLVYLAVTAWFSTKAVLIKKEEKEPKIPPIEVVSEEVFKEPVLETVKGFTQFGQLPVVVDKDQQGKENPFMP